MFWGLGLGATYEISCILGFRGFSFVFGGEILALIAQAAENVLAVGGMPGVIFPEPEVGGQHLGFGVPYFNTFLGTCYLQGTIMK